MKQKMVIVTYLLIIMFADVSVLSQETSPADKNTKYRSPFRYVIVANEVEPAINKNDEARRTVTTLLDKKSFSKENLVTLFRLVSKRFPRPKLLYIHVYTDLADVETPEEADIGKFSDYSDCMGLCMQDSAIFIRHNKKKLFYIYFADGRFEKSEIN
jgi:hypothetical protein